MIFGLTLLSRRIRREAEILMLRQREQ